MGLVDVLNGMMNGPRGRVTPSPSGGSSGMSPIKMGLLALLDYKAMKGGGIFGGSNPTQPHTPAGSIQGPNQGIGTDWLGGLGSLISGSAGGSILTGGLGELVKKFQQTGRPCRAIVGGDWPQQFYQSQ
jgi:hypothetical protein